MNWWQIALMILGTVALVALRWVLRMLAEVFRAIEHEQRYPYD